LSSQRRRFGARVDFGVATGGDHRKFSNFLSCDLDERGIDMTF
jgi:hypothetical protein